MSKPTRVGPKSNTSTDISGQEFTGKDKKLESKEEMPEHMLWDEGDIDERYAPPLQNQAIPSIPVVMDKPKKPRGRPKSDKLSQHQIEYDLIDWMAGERIPDGLKNATPFPANFRTYFQDESKRNLELIEIKDGLATIASDQVLYDALVKSIKSFTGPASQYQIPYRQIEQLAKSFIKEPMRCRLKQAPAIFCWESQKDILAFNRVPNPAPDWKFFYGTDEFKAKAPLWADFIDRNEEKDAVRAFFGSLLFPDSSHKQSLHLCGPGDAGKTTMIEVLLECFFGKRGFAAFEPKVENDLFYKEEWIGKMAMFADEIPDWFYKTNEYKKLTGAENHRINIKFKSSYLANITAKLIATSNLRPAIPPDQAVCDRLIISNVSSLTHKDTDRNRLKARILAEMPYIIADCLEAFRWLEGKKIKVGDNNHEESLEIYAAPMQELFDRYFKHSPGQRLEINIFRTLITRHGDKMTNYSQMRAFVIQKYRCEFNFRDKSSRYLSNISLKSGATAGLNLS